jgi:hypothetical protein
VGTARIHKTWITRYRSVNTLKSPILLCVP